MKKVCFLWAVSALLTLTGCEAVDSVVSATREKTLAVGCDTWGGGVDMSLAEAEQPVPSLSGWFGRRRVWYISVKDEKSGDAAARIVKAGLSSVELSAAASGVTLSEREGNL